MEITKEPEYEVVEAEDFKDDIHYYLTKLANKNEKDILIKGKYGEIVVMPREKFIKNIFDAFMIGLDKNLQNSGLTRIDKKLQGGKK